MRKSGCTWFAVAAAWAILALAPVAEAATVAVRGVVQDGSKQPVAGAAVYLVPAADVAKLAKPPSIEIRKDVPNDEPLEDSLAANRDRYAKGTTDATGAFTISGVADGKYFVYVEPTDRDHLPGGDLAKKAMAADDLARKPLAIQVSGKVPDTATYVGSTRCLACHNAYSGQVKKTLHKLGITVVGKPSKLQDFSRFPGFNDGLNKLMAGTKLYFSGFDKKRGFDKYVVAAKPPADPATLSFTATFFKDTDGKLKFRTENARDASDPPRTYTVEMTYGGGLYKQRYLYRVDKALFPFLQYNTTGNDAYGDRTRTQWRDYHGDWLYDDEAKKLKNPPKLKTFERECASCHFTGYTLTTTAAGDFVAGAVNDRNGEADIDGDGVPNELNIGCEVCHGPGSAHAKSAKARKAATIVNPAKLAAERATVICAQCHTRPQGNLKNDQPVSKQNRMLVPGISRNEYLTSYTIREDAPKGAFWGDGVHSKAHHQQGTDFIRSKKYVNGTQLLSCDSCHDPHGRSEVKHQLRLEVRDPGNSLCASCHTGVAIKAHTEKAVGVEHEKTNCVDCHATKTAQTGAGWKGLAKKDAKNYWTNDITSHLFGVPRRANTAVKGVEPGKAMPIPFTNACATCHDVDAL